VFLEAGMGWLTWYFRRLDQQSKELRVEVPWVKHLPSHRPAQEHPPVDPTDG
jgi:uncharacterized protein